MEVLKRTHPKSRIVRLDLAYQTDTKLLSMRDTSDQTILQLITNDRGYIAEIVPKSVLKEEEERYKEKLSKTKELIEDKIKFWKGRLEKIEAERRKRIDNYGRKKETNTLNEEMEYYRQEANISYNVLDVLEKLLKEGFNGD